MKGDGLAQAPVSFIFSGLLRYMLPLFRRPGYQALEELTSPTDTRPDITMTLSMRAEDTADSLT